MPSSLHETLLELFTRNPPLAAALVSDVFHTKLPAWQQASVGNAQFNDLQIADMRADAVITLTDDNDKAVAAIVVEIQTSPNPDKKYVWPAYLANLWHRHKIPAQVLVVCPTETLADTFRDPIEFIFGAGPMFSPLVIGPELVPVITDPAQAVANPELAVLSAMAHGNENHDVLEASVTGVQGLDDDQRPMYYDLIVAGLDTIARKFLEAIMATTTEPLSDIFRDHWQQGREQGIEQGREQAKAADVLTVLGARGMQVPDDARARITECSDLDQLETWLRRAVTVDSIQDLFTD